MMSTAEYDAQLKLIMRNVELPDVPEDIHSSESVSPYSTLMPPHPDDVSEAPNAHIAINAALDYIDTIVPPWEHEEPRTQANSDDSFEYDFSHEDPTAATQTQTNGGQTVTGETTFFDYVFHGDQTQGGTQESTHHPEQVSVESQQVVTLAHLPQPCQSDRECVMRVPYTSSDPTAPGSTTRH